MKSFFLGEQEGKQFLPLLACDRPHSWGHCVFVKHPKFGTVPAESLAPELTGTILARRATAEHVLNFLSP